jgi:adenine-specific DNA-methyltransferase
MSDNLLAQLEHLNEQQLRRLLVEHLTKQKLGLYWEASAIERDAALNADLVLPRLMEEWSHSPSVRPELVEGGMDGSGSTGSPRTEFVSGDFTHRNLIIEGDNFDSLRLLKATHAGKIRVIYIAPPDNTGNMQVKNVNNL